MQRKRAQPLHDLLPSAVRQLCRDPDIRPFPPNRKKSCGVSAIAVPYRTARLRTSWVCQNSFLKNRARLRTNLASKWTIHKDAIRLQVDTEPQSP